MARYLKEHLSFTQAGLEILSEEAHDGSKTLKLKGVCIEGGVRNANERDKGEMKAAMKRKKQR